MVIFHAHISPTFSCRVTIVKILPELFQSCLSANFVDTCTMAIAVAHIKTLVWYYYVTGNSITEYIVDTVYTMSDHHNVMGWGWCLKQTLPLRSMSPTEYYMQGVCLMLNTDDFVVITSLSPSLYS